MARDTEGLKLRRWGTTAATKQTPENAGLTRAGGWSDAYAADSFPPLGVFNQVWLELTSLLSDLAEHGVLHWNAAQAYLHDPVAYVVGTDGRLYQSVQASGGSNTSQDPVTDTTFTYWRPVIGTTSGRIIPASNTIIEAGTNNQDFLTAAALLSLFKANPNARWQADGSKFGLTRFGTMAEINAGAADRAVNGAVLNTVLANLNVAVSNASTTVRGIARLATLAEARAGTNTEIITTPEGVAAYIAQRVATTTLAGIAELATLAEARAGTDTSRITTPAGVAAAIVEQVVAATTSVAGIARLATLAEARAGTDTSRITTPAGVAAAIVEQVVAATTSAAGIARLATADQARAGTNTNRIVTPQGVAAAITDRVATTGAAGIARLATLTEARAGTNTNRIVTPQGVAAAITERLGVSLLDRTTELAAGTHTFTLAGVSNYDTLEFLLPDPGGAIYTRIPRTALGDAVTALYTIDAGGDSLYTVDASDGSITLVGSLGTGEWESLTSHNGQLYAINDTNENLYTVDDSDGSVVLVGSLGAGGWESLASHNGQLYAINDGNENLYTVDASDGSIASVGSLGTGGWESLASHNGQLYAINDGNENLYTVDASDGSIASVGSLGTGEWESLTSHNGQLYAINDSNVSLYTVDASDGSITLVGSLGTGTWESLTSHVIRPAVSPSLRASLAGTTLTVQNSAALSYLQVNGLR